jgi:sugar (pentulose or hexulose) kinase
MHQVPVIAIFDVGKTNKKLFLFNEKYEKVYEESIQLKETTDEDGDACEDLALLSEWLRNRFENVMQLPGFEIKAINFSAYGASFVHLVEEGKALLPLYNYLKPYPKDLQNEFYNTYGGELKIAKETASPVSGNLNSGLQLYRIKKQQPQLFADIRKSLHLPQYLSFLITNQLFSDITSIGCHTSLWNFETGKYHQWVYDEGIDKKLSPVKNSDETLRINFQHHSLMAGIGLHDSSAALIPYLLNFEEPFILISTGTWCISLNPFNNTPLTAEELNNDCLCYLQYRGLPVKAHRLFAGYEHGQEVQKLSERFSKPIDYYEQVSYNETFIKEIKSQKQFLKSETPSFFFNAEEYDTYEKSYHGLMLGIMEKQIAGIRMILKEMTVKRIFVDGGFSKNIVYMNLLAASFPGLEVFAASMPHATAMGAALAIHDSWNTQPIPGDIIKLKLCPSPQSKIN